MMAKMFYTMDETKNVLGRNEEEIKQLAREGRLREFRDGPRLMFKADQVEDAKNCRQVSGDHPKDAAMLRALIHTVSVSRNDSSHLSLRAISFPSPLQPQCTTSASKMYNLADRLRRGFLFPGDTASRL